MQSKRKIISFMMAISMIVLSSSTIMGRSVFDPAGGDMFEVDPEDCATNTFADAIAINGDLTCSAIGDADVPNNITIDLASTATALASNPTDCTTNNFATTIDASGNLACSQVDIVNGTTGTLAVDRGGTGATTLTDGGILLGSGTGAVTALGVASNGQIPIGDGTTDPVLATITGTANQVIVTNGAGTITLSAPTKHFTATATLDFDLSASASQNLTITVTGAALGDAVSIGVPNGSVTADTLFWGWVSAPDTVTVRAMRIAGTPNPASGTFRADVWQ